MTDGFVNIPGGRIHFERQGQGAPLVLLHGFSFDLRSWDLQVDAFAARHDVLRYDLRGFGASSLPDGPYSHADDAVAVLDALGIERAVFLGLSLGANVALEVAVRHPARVNALVLASPGLPGFPYFGEHPSDLAKRLTQSEGLAAGRAAWLGHAIFNVAQENPRALAELKKVVDAYSGWHWMNDNPARAVALRDRLNEVRLPVQVIGGARDLPYFNETARLLAAGISGAHATVFPDGGHVPIIENADRFNATVLAFLDALAATAHR